MTRLIIVTTYNRQAYLDELLPHLATRGTVWVFDDGSDKRARVPQGVTCYHRPHHGRENYYTLIGSIFKRLRAVAFDRLCILPDDVTPVGADPLWDAEDIWNEVVAADEYAIGLNPLVDRRGIISQWGGNHPVRVTPRAWLTGWNDLCLYGDYAPLARALSSAALKPPADYLHGSGVGSQVTRHLRKYGNLYQVADTLWHHREGPSVMCPEHRIHVPL